MYTASLKGRGKMYSKVWSGGAGTDVHCKSGQEGRGQMYSKVWSGERGQMYTASLIRRAATDVYTASLIRRDGDRRTVKSGQESGDRCTVKSGQESGDRRKLQVSSEHCRYCKSVGLMYFANQTPDSYTE